MQATMYKYIFFAVFFFTCSSCHRNQLETLTKPKKVDEHEALATPPTTVDDIALLRTYVRQLGDPAPRNLEPGSSGRFGAVAYAVSLNHLGKGGEGAVFEVVFTDKKSRNVIALKKIDGPDMQEITKQVADMMKGFPPENREEMSKKILEDAAKLSYKNQEAEAKALEKVSGTPGVIEYYGSFRDQLGNFYLAMPKMDGPFVGQFSPKIFDRTAKILVALKAKDIVHNDISPANFLAKNGDPYLSDFGLATNSEAVLNDEVNMGTAFFVNPERNNFDVSLKKVDPFKTDLFSLGMVLFAWKHPDVFERAQERVLKGLAEDEAPPYDDTFARQLREDFKKAVRDPYDDLIVSMIDPDIETRISVEILVEKMNKKYKPLVRSYPWYE